MVGPCEALALLLEVKAAHDLESYEHFEPMGAHKTVQRPTLRSLTIQSESLSWWEPRVRKTLFSLPFLRLCTWQIAWVYKGSWGSPICVSGPALVPCSSKKKKKK